MKKHRMFAVVLAIALLMIGCKGFLPGDTELSGATGNLMDYIMESQYSQDYTATMDILQGIYVNSVLYMPDEELSRVANKENVGEFVGYVSYNNIIQTEICAFRYLPDDGKICRIVVYSGGSFAVYTFGAYVPDGTDIWPIKLLENVAYVEISGQNTSLKGHGKNDVITDDRRVEQIVMFLSNLGEKHNETEINRRYYELFKEYFPDGAIWINKDGRVVARDIELTVQLSNMINQNDSDITVVMKDYTKLVYIYRPSSNLIICHDFAYYLSDEQEVQIKQMLDWE